MAFRLSVDAHFVDLYSLVDSALPAQWVGFIALGLIAVSTAIVIGLVLLADGKRQNHMR